VTATVSAPLHPLFQKDECASAEAQRRQSAPYAPHRQQRLTREDCLPDRFRARDGVSIFIAVPEQAERRAFVRAPPPWALTSPEWRQASIRFGPTANDTRDPDYPSTATLPPILSEFHVPRTFCVGLTATTAPLRGGKVRERSASVLIHKKQFKHCRRESPLSPPFILLIALASLPPPSHTHCGSGSHLNHFYSAPLADAPVSISSEQ
jgi:hypothetical protein